MYLTIIRQILEWRDINVKIKTIIIFIILSIVLIVIGFAGGFYTKTLMDEAQLIKEKEKQKGEKT